MRDKKTYYLLAVVLILGLIMYKYNKSKSTVSKETVPIINTPIGTPITAPSAISSSASIQLEKNKAISEAIQKATSKNEESKKMIQENSDNAKRTLSNTAYLQFSLPSKYVASSVDVDDALAGVIGRSGQSKEFLGVFARKGLTSEKELLGFLPEFSRLLPEVSVDITQVKSQTLAVPVDPRSGLKDCVILKFKTADFQLYIFRGHRVDNKGSYFLIGQAETKNESQINQDIQNTINSFKALPAK